MKPQVNWTDDHSDALKQLLGTCSYAEIAKALNARFKTSYTRNACIGRAQRMGLCGPQIKHDPEDVKARRVARDLKRNRKRLENRRARGVKPRQVSHIKLVRNEAVLRCAAIEPLHLSIAVLEPHHCRYPYGEGPFTFCGHDKFSGSYCAAHYFLALGAGTVSERAAHKVSKNKLGAWQ